MPAPGGVGPGRLRCAGFAGALLIYGAAGMPAPPGIRWQELLIFAGLLAMTGLAGPARLVTGLALGRRDRGPAPELGVASAVLMLLVWLGLVRGIWNGWTVRDMVRDIVPLGFLALPVLLAPSLALLSARMRDLLADCAGLAGVMLVLRWAHNVGPQALASIGTTPLGEGGDYLLNSALVPFAAVWLVLRAITLLDGGAADGWPWRRLRAGLFLSGGMLCLLAMAATVHRAGLGLSLLALLIGLGRPLMRRPFLVLLALACLILVPILAGAPMTGMLALAADKTQAVGVNNRSSEILAVLEQVWRDPVPFFIGDGWGALVVNPAVGYWRVSYTHSAPSYFLLKVGVLGCVGIALYAGCLAARMGALWKGHPYLVLAALPPTLIGSLLHTSYKYICFSLIVSLVVGSSYNSLYKCIQRLHSFPRDGF
ncbi:hypothetical protein [Niveispirillum irakense]|uniref:hypothetical protein n=1 Tax=Niveispirillum irakense TaxID=34011 RepID=UPI0004239179|nr:hypothetical protein [Niveispirillum irakense]